MRRSDGQRSQGDVPRSARTNGVIPNSCRAISSYLRIVQSGASTVARSAASVASSIVDRDSVAGHDQVLWAGFDKLEGETIRQVLLLGYRSGFQVWDVEELDNIYELVSRNDGPVSFIQILPKPIASKRSQDKFADSRPLLVACGDVSFSGRSNQQQPPVTPGNGEIPNGNDWRDGSILPSVVRFYSFTSHSYVHVLKFRSVVYAVRCSCRVVAVALASQIQCFDATTLEREYTILTNPIVNSYTGPGGLGYGPLALGPRWIAYSGSPVANSDSGRVSPQHLTPSASFGVSNPNGSLVAHYAKESSKQLAAGIATLGDMGYKKLTRYCSELLPNGNNSLQTGNPGRKGYGLVNRHSTGIDDTGMVVVRDMVRKNVIAQFKAHKSPISALCFDSSGTLLVTASVQGHNINVFMIMPEVSGSSFTSEGVTYAHLYILQRGFTNAVIQDINFSDDSNWIMISSSRGTSHLFAINRSGGTVNILSADGLSSRNSGSSTMMKILVRWPPNSSSQQRLCVSGPPIALSAISRIRNGSKGWRGTVSGAAAAATGRPNCLAGPIASSFHKSKSNDLGVSEEILKAKYHLLVFCPSGCMIQYALKIATGIETPIAIPGLSPTHDIPLDCEGILSVEAIQKWDICQKQYRREQEDNVDIYGENGSSSCNMILPEEMRFRGTFNPELGLAGKKSYANPEENHLYISEVELQMHQAQVPLWARPVVCFQLILMDGNQIEEPNALGGEIELERIPTRTIETRVKHLVPLHDHLQAPVLQKARSSSLGYRNTSHILHQRSGLSEYDQLSCRSFSGSLNSVTPNDAMMTESCNGLEDSGWDGPKTIESKVFQSNTVNLNKQSHPQIVHDRS